MVKLSCFPVHILNRSSKKAVQHHSAQIFPGKMNKEVPGLSLDTGNKESPSSACSNWNTDGVFSSSTLEQTETPTFECEQSEEFNMVSYALGDQEISQTSHLKKSQSLGSGLDRGVFSHNADCEEGLDERFLFVSSGEKGQNKGLNSFNKCGSVDSFDRYEPGIKYSNEDPRIHSFEEKLDLVHHESLFSIGDPKVIDAELHEESYEQCTAGYVAKGNFIHGRPPIFKSRSSPSLCGPKSPSLLPVCEFPSRSRSFGALRNGHIRHHSQVSGGLYDRTCHQVGALHDFHHLEISSNLAENKSSCQADILEEHVGFNSNDYSGELLEQERDALFGLETCGYDIQFSGEYGFNNLNDFGYDSGDIQKQEIEERVNQEEYPFHKWDELTGQELNKRRVEDWLSQIDIHGKCPVEEFIEVQSSGSNAKMKDNVHNNAFKHDTRGNPGMEAAYNYISSLTSISTSAQMAGLGLVVIPFLSAFNSLRLLNLSGNSIVRITAGALPRGLHMLNLSRNNISTIEGLRDLTRLRVLDLSYNRILRIGHGLSACSSLKELYLAGNKISEVEGLHRLLKLSILDLCYNKISTTKSLGQLAANYGSLQAINLDGNPAQRNVGDEQLKKYVLSLLPHLVYFNKHVIKASSSKEVSDRSRSSTSHQFDRSLRSEQKKPRRGHHGSSHKLSTLSGHGKPAQPTSSLLKHSRMPHAPLPPLGSRPGHHQTVVDPKLLNLQLSNPIRRSRSAGNLG